MARVGVDLSKRVFQLHAVDRSGRVMLAKALTPDGFCAWCDLGRLAAEGPVLSERFGLTGGAC